MKTIDLSITPEDEIAKIMEEGAILARLDHVNIIKYVTSFK